MAEIKVIVPQQVHQDYSGGTKGVKKKQPHQLIPDANLVEADAIPATLETATTIDEVLHVVSGNVDILHATLINIIDENELELEPIDKQKNIRAIAQQFLNAKSMVDEKRQLAASTQNNDPADGSGVQLLPNKVTGKPNAPLDLSASENTDAGEGDGDDQLQPFTESLILEDQAAIKEFLINKSFAEDFAEKAVAEFYRVGASREGIAGDQEVDFHYYDPYDVLKLLFEKSIVLDTAVQIWGDYGPAMMVLIDGREAMAPVEDTAEGKVMEGVINEKDRGVDDETEYPDDALQNIAGIGPKIEQVLNEAGITSFAQLKTMSAAAITETMVKIDANMHRYDPVYWPRQAELADAGKWDELEAFKEEIKPGALPK